MDESERAALNKTQADRDAIYLANGILSQEEVRQRLKINKDVFLVKIDASQRVGEKENKPQKVHLYDIIEKSREDAYP